MPRMNPLVREVRVVDQPDFLESIEDLGNDLGLEAAPAQLCFQLGTTARPVGQEA